MRFIEGQEHWTEEIAPQLEEQEVAALITTRACGPADRVTRQCVKCAHDYKIHFCRSPDVSTALWHLLQELCFSLVKNY